MAQLLDELVDRIRALPAAEQESSVRFVLGELEEDQRWTASTLAHAEAIATLTKRVLEDDAQELTEPLDPDTL